MKFLSDTVLTVSFFFALIFNLYGLYTVISYMEDIQNSLINTDELMYELKTDYQYLELAFNELDEKFELHDSVQTKIFKNVPPNTGVTHKRVPPNKGTIPKDVTPSRVRPKENTHKSNH